MIILPIDLTTVLAVYGAITSTIILIYRIRERRELRRRFKLQLDKHYKPNDDQINYHNGRKGDQYLQVQITNRSIKENSIAEAHFVQLTNRFEKPKKIAFNFSFYPRTKFPIELGYTEQISILTPLNMLPGEFHQSWNSNAQVLQGLTSKYIKAVIVDMHGKRYYSNSIDIRELIAAFIDFEEKVTSEGYRKNDYRSR